MKNTVLKCAVLIALPAFCAVPSSLHATTIFSENFNEVPVSLTLTTAGAFSAIDGTNIDVVGGGLCLALSARGPNPAIALIWVVQAETRSATSN